MTSCIELCLPYEANVEILHASVSFPQETYPPCSSDQFLQAFVDLEFAGAFHGEYTPISNPAQLYALDGRIMFSDYHDLPPLTCSIETDRLMVYIPMILVDKSWFYYFSEDGREWTQMLDCDTFGKDFCTHLFMQRCFRKIVAKKLGWIEAADPAAQKKTPT